MSEPQQWHRRVCCLLVLAFESTCDYVVFRDLRVEVADISTEAELILNRLCAHTLLANNS
eukprot:6056313-Amphidinium_carterae.1